MHWMPLTPAALCIATGACGQLSPAGVIAKLRADAAAQPASYGFVGDPRAPLGTNYFGYLLSVASYQGSATAGPNGGSVTDTPTAAPGGRTTTGTAPRGKKRGPKK